MSTKKAAGPLHPLPVPDKRGDSVGIIFVRPLPEDQGFNYLITFSDHLQLDTHLVPAQTLLTAPELTDLFFNHWYCKNRLPLEIISNCSKLFISQFWKAFHARTGVKIKMSTAYHPETNGESKQTNKTVIQALQFHVQRNQKGWVRALPHVCSDLMNIINHLTGFLPFQLHLVRSPHLSPPLIKTTTTSSEKFSAE